MQFFPDSYTFVNIGMFSIRYYALLIVAGGIIAYLLSKKQMLKAGLTSDQVDDITIGIIVCGILGARLWYCLWYDPAYYFSNPVNLLKIYEGGLAIHGGLLAGILFGFIYAKLHHFSILRLIDCILPNVLIAQAIGRWGNFINKEAYGQVCSEKSLWYLPEFIKNGMLIDGSYRQPTFLLESIFDLAGFIIIVLIVSKHFSIKRGDRSYMYLMWYGLSRFIVEIYRSDALMAGSLKMAQIISIVFFVVGLLGYLGLYDKLLPKKKPVVIFDFDGTLVDTSMAIETSFKKTLEKHNCLNVFNEEFRQFMLGPSPDVVFRKYCPDLDDQQCLQEYREFNVQDQKDYNKLFVNVTETLQQLNDQGYQLAVVSTKAREALQQGLDMFDLNKYFACIVAGDEVKESKPNPEGLFKVLQHLKGSKDNAIYVGDSVNDIYAGLNGGLYSVAYLSYDLKREQLLHCGANASIEDMSQLIPLIESVKTYSSTGR